MRRPYQMAPFFRPIRRQIRFPLRREEVSAVTQIILAESQESRLIRSVG